MMDKVIQIYSIMDEKTWNKMGNYFICDLIANIMKCMRYNLYITSMRKTKTSTYQFLLHSFTHPMMVILFCDVTVLSSMSYLGLYWFTARYFFLFETVCWICYNYSFGQISSVIRKQLENGTLHCNKLISVTLPSSDAACLTILFLCSTQLPFSKISDFECKLEVVPKHGCCYDLNSIPINARIFPLLRKVENTPNSFFLLF